MRSAAGPLVLFATCLSMTGCRATRPRPSSKVLIDSIEIGMSKSEVEGKCGIASIHEIDGIPGVWVYRCNEEDIGIVFVDDRVSQIYGGLHVLHYRPGP